MAWTYDGPDRPQDRYPPPEGPQPAEWRVRRVIARLLDMLAREEAEKEESTKAPPGE